jgi:acyl-CoA reductase-like NAD-dependent aldehyde dehydrogenase
VSPFTGGTRVDVGGVAVSTDHYIGGQRVASPSTFEDRSPLDWSLKLADVSRGDAHTADLAVQAAMDAFPEWAAMGVKGRGDVMRRVADLIDEHVPSLAAVECLDMAMLEESLRLRVLSRGARNFRAYADLAEQYEERVWSSNGTANRVMRMPAGPTVVITPWNAPFMLSTWKCAPALAAGNTVILKPAEWSPLSCSLLADLCHEAGMPAGVFNVVQGIGEEVGAALVSDPRLTRISFTGSPDTAKHIGRAAAENIVPFTAELGGKGPFSCSPTATWRPRRRRPPASTTTAVRCASPARGSWSRHPCATSSSSCSTASPTHTCWAIRARPAPPSAR